MFRVNLDRWLIFMVRNKVINYIGTYLYGKRSTKTINFIKSSGDLGIIFFFLFFRCIS